MTNLAYALDLGTTMLDGSLVDLSSGRAMVRGQCPNPQFDYGADVMTRLTLAMRSRNAARAMQRLVLESAMDLLRSLCEECGTALDRVTSGVLVANTAMHHLALGLDVATLAIAPYKPVLREAGVVELQGLPPMYIVPLIASYVGSDAVGAALSTNLSPESMLIDAGTNTEVLLCRDKIVFAASAPAGPAFEGGELDCGMPAQPGAACSVAWKDDDLTVATVGGAAPRGLCGSGLMDTVAVLLEAGLLDETGRLQAGGPLSDRVVFGETGRAVGFQVSAQVVLTQKDIRAFQLAKGAVRAACEVLMRHADVEAGAVKKVFLAGAFGTAVSAESALVTGLLPPVDPAAVRPVGNAALAGAERLAYSSSARRSAEILAGSARHVELSTDPRFQEEFLDSLNFHMAMPQGTR